MIVLLNTVCAEEDEASVSELQCLSITKITKITKIQARGCHVLKSIPFAQHQCVLMRTELVCLSIIMITKKQGRGGPCWEGWASYSHVKCLLHVTVCCCHADLRQR